MHGAVSRYGPIAKKIAEETNDEPYIVSIMPCTAKKDESVRPGNRGDIDAVLTTRELAKMIRHRNIPFASLPNDGVYDSPMGESSGAAAIFAASGGVMEAALRTAADALGLKGMVEYKGVRGVDRGVKQITIEGERDAFVKICIFANPFDFVSLADAITLESHAKSSLPNSF